MRFICLYLLHRLYLIYTCYLINIFSTANVDLLDGQHSLVHLDVSRAWMLIGSGGTGTGGYTDTGGVNAPRSNTLVLVMMTCLVWTPF